MARTSKNAKTLRICRSEGLRCSGCCCFVGHDFRHCPVLAIDVREYDLVADGAAVDEISARVRQQLEGELPQTELWPAVSRRVAFA